MEVVERVEELFHRPLLAGDELDVVDQEQVGGAVAAAKLLVASPADGGDKVVGKLLRRDVDHPQATGEQRVAHGMQQVRLAESYAAVNEYRVVGLARVLGGADAGREREAVIVAL